MCSQEILVRRDQWGEEPTLDGIEVLRLPATRIIASHTEDEQDTCNSRVEIHLS